MLLTLLILGAVGCAPSAEPDRLDKLLPDIPANTNFGPLYPHVEALLSGPSPDTASAVRDTHRWAEDRLEGFSRGSCGDWQVVGDTIFTQLFGRSTLGVTLPWMQIYLRDGRRHPDPYLWKDPSLFVSTILHEYVHSAQRVRQAAEFIAPGAGCTDARDALVRRRGVWGNGFEQLRTNIMLSDGYNDGEKALLYRWISPIQRALDEVEASLQTVRWMNARPDELNAYTMGGANNWAYAVQFLLQLKALGTSDCFSPDEDTYDEELRGFQSLIPAYTEELSSLEPGMRQFLLAHNVATLQFSLSGFAAVARPGGRLGATCAPIQSVTQPRMPFVLED